VPIQFLPPSKRTNESLLIFPSLIYIIMTASILFLWRHAEHAARSSHSNNPIQYFSLRFCLIDPVIGDRYREISYWLPFKVCFTRKITAKRIVIRLPTTLIRFFFPLACGDRHRHGSKLLVNRIMVFMFPMNGSSSSEGPRRNSSGCFKAIDCIDNNIPPRELIHWRGTAIIPFSNPHHHGGYVPLLLMSR